MNLKFSYFGAEPASSTSHVTETELNITSTLVNTSQVTSSVPMLQNEQTLTQQCYHTTGDNPMKSNSSLTANNLSLLLVLSITPVGFVWLISSIILFVIPAGIWSKCYQDLVIKKIRILLLLFSLQKEIRVSLVIC